MKSMTREEAAHILEYSRIVSENFTQEAVTATYVMALAALRGPTREMAERMFPGCKMCKPVCHKCKNYPLALYPQACKTCVEHSNFEAVSNFCEDCGRPMTEKALDMMMENWKEAVPRSTS